MSTKRKYLVESIENLKENRKKAHIIAPTPLHSRHLLFLFCKLFSFSKGSVYYHARVGRSQVLLTKVIPIPETFTISILKVTQLYFIFIVKDLLLYTISYSSPKLDALLSYLMLSYLIFMMMIKDLLLTISYSSPIS